MTAHVWSVVGAVSFLVCFICLLYALAAKSKGAVAFDLIGMCIAAIAFLLNWSH